MDIRLDERLYLILIALFFTNNLTEAVGLRLNETTTIRDKRESECARHQFECKDGSCISRLLMCDAEQNCKDGSDEIFETCRTILCPDSSYTFRCNYGACILNQLRCNGVKDCHDGSDEADCSKMEGCILPKQARYGRFEMNDGSTYIPNKLVQPTTTIFLICNNGQAHDSLYFCQNTQWRPSIANAKCRKPGSCTSIQTSSSDEVVCKLNGAPTSCEEPEANTTATVRCKPFYTFNGYRPIYKCQNGKWSESFTPCHPECGLKTVGANTLLVGGSETIHHEYPWVVAVYNGTNDQICAGTIISRLYVLSAAHCFSTADGKPMNKDNYTIVAGKYYRNIDIVEQASQSRKIKFLYIHEDYRGQLQKYRDDIAVIELNKAFTLSYEVQPVCVDWEGTYEDFDFVDGNEGVVTGWGNIHTVGEQSPVLKKLVVPFRSKNVCVKELDPDFQQRYYTADKICAGYKDQNKTACNGDSGGGFVFKSDSRKFYIRGVVSIASRAKVGCDSNTYNLYTKVSKYLQWMEGKTGRVL